MQAADVFSPLPSQGRGQGEGSPPKLSDTQSLTSILSLLVKGEAPDPHSALMLLSVGTAAPIAKKMISGQTAGECLSPM